MIREGRHNIDLFIFVFLCREDIEFDFLVVFYFFDDVRDGLFEQVIIRGVQSDVINIRMKNEDITTLLKKKNITTQEV